MNYAKLLGYKKEDDIFRTYIRVLKDFVKDEANDYRKFISTKLLQNSEITMVILFLFFK